MNRSPLFYPLNRGLDADAGGTADLQTDVMRFMAILSLCLVAIFALVQSIPLAPAEPPPETIAEVSEVDEPALPEKPEPRAPIDLVRPAPARLPPKEIPVALNRPEPERVERTNPRVKSAEPIVEKASAMEAVSDSKSAETPTRFTERRGPASNVQNGFTLRFESDAALSRLVERDFVGLYAISGSAIHRMQIESGRMSFWPASVPQRFHEMDAATVPAVVVDHWRRSKTPGDVKWGVSLPAPMAGDLDKYLSTLEGGSLVIGRDGQLRLEQ